MIKKISDKDKKDWADYLSQNEHFPNKDSDISFKKIRKTVYTLDLHGLTLNNANRAVEDLINVSFEKGVNKLKIITGKGIHSQNEKNPYVSKKLGILKYSIPDYIKNKSDLMEKINNIQDASLEDGGKGAFYIYLKKNL